MREETEWVCEVSEWVSERARELAREKQREQKDKVQDTDWMRGRVKESGERYSEQNQEINKMRERERERERQSDWLTKIFHWVIFSWLIFLNVLWNFTFLQVIAGLYSNSYILL